MKQYNKKYGQVFLNDRNIAQYEVSLLDPSNNVLEIGPGDGALTELLLEIFPQVTVVESDHRFVEILNAKFFDLVQQGRLLIIHGNFLECELPEFEQIIGNIPYHISSPILGRIAEMNFKKAIIMVQKEFAQSLIAKPSTPNYTKLTVFSNLNFHIKLIKAVSRNSFSPVPKVDSAILELVKRENIIKIPREYTNNTLAKLFSQKRKKIKNILQDAPQNRLDLRVDQLTPEEIMDMVETIYTNNLEADI